MWSYICNFYDSVNRFLENWGYTDSFDYEGFNEIFKSYAECCKENRHYFKNKYIIVIEKTIDNDEHYRV